jgi:hypothetical protein
VARVLVLISMLMASVASAQVPTLGAPITLHGVSVSGFAAVGERGAGRRTQSRQSTRIAIFAGHASRGRAHTTFHVCGLDAVRSIVSVARMPSSRVQIRPDDPSAHLVVPERAARTYVRVEIPRTIEGRDRLVIVEWSVDTARRDALRATEDAFFASIRCDA